MCWRQIMKHLRGEVSCIRAFNWHIYLRVRSVVIISNVLNTDERWMRAPLSLSLCCSGGLTLSNLVTMTKWSEVFLWIPQCDSSNEADKQQQLSVIRPLWLLVTPHKLCFAFTVSYLPERSFILRHPVEISSDLQLMVQRCVFEICRSEQWLDSLHIRSLITVNLSFFSL